MKNRSHYMVMDDEADDEFNDNKFVYKQKFFRKANSA